jgi:hypothetical protein
MFIKERPRWNDDEEGEGCSTQSDEESESDVLKEETDKK